MGKDSSPPPAPDYAAAAQQTAQGNLEMAQFTTQANRVNQYSPWGSSTWTKTGGRTFDQAGYDAAMADYQKRLDQHNANLAQYQQSTNEYGSIPFTPFLSFGSNTSIGTSQYGLAPSAPSRDSYYYDAPEQWSQTTNVTPELQAALDAQINTQKNRSQYASAMLDRVKNAYAQDFQAPDLNTYLKDIQALDQNKLSSTSYTQGIPELDYSAPEAQSYFNDVHAVNQNAPVLDTEARKRYEQAAFDSADALLSRGYATDEQSLRDSLALQGLNPMSQASNQATSSFYDSKNAAYNQLANQSILTGNQMANADYASQLAGFNATNAARGQAFTQANQSYTNALQQFAAKNAVRQQGFSNAMTGFGADMAAQNTANSARQQAYANAINKWQTDYTVAKSKRDMPLNEMNALLTGQQVQMPQFPGYAMQANVSGPDLLGAASAQYQADLGAWNAEQASSAGLLGSLLGAGAQIGSAWLLRK